MPLKIIRQDITKIKCDAIVNPTNSDMLPGGGVDAAIHEAAGEELYALFKTLGTLPVGEARITPAFRLPSKYVIHTVGPEWRGGKEGERMLLRSCYRESMELAIRHDCKSIAFPLISSGAYGYPKERVLREAEEVLSEYLKSYELDVYLVVYDKSSYCISLELYRDVQSFIDTVYVNLRERKQKLFLFDAEISALPFDGETRASRIRESRIESIDKSVAPENTRKLSASESLDDMLRKMDKGFAEILFELIDKRGIDDVEAYKRSNVGKKTFSKIKCNKDYKPSKLTAVSFAIGLHLDLCETTRLLSSVGMCLSHSNKFDVIIEYFVTSGNYKTVFDVNEVLYQFDQPLLGV